MSVYEFLNRVTGTTFSSNSELPFKIEEKSFSKNEVITKYNEVEQNFYFLTEGAVQAEVSKEDGSECILDFIFPNQFFNAYISYINQTPSFVQISSLSECKVEIINGMKIKELYTDSLLMNKIVRLVTEEKFIEKTQREIDFLTKSAQERYLDLFQSNPKIMKEVPANRIAKYLGIKPESLSRIRKDLLS